MLEDKWLTEKFFSRKLWFGVVAPLAFLQQGWIGETNATFIICTALAGMAIVDSVRAWKGLPAAWQNPDVKVLKN